MDKIDEINYILNNNYLIPNINNIVYRYWLPRLNTKLSNQIKINAIFLLFNSIDKKWKKSNLNISYTEFILNNYRDYFDEDECKHIINVLNNCKCCKLHEHNCFNSERIYHICLCYSKQLKNIIIYILNY